MTFVKRHAAALLAGGSGFVFAASTPPIDFQPGILLGLVGFACSLSLEDAQTARDARGSLRSGVARGFWFGLCANLLALRFVPEVMARFTPLPAIAGWLALLLLSAAQALPWIIGGALARWLAHPPKTSRRLAAPAWIAFAICVYIALFVPAVFPWTPAGGLARWPVLLQTAEVVGERGTSFLVAIGCGLVAEGVHHIRILIRIRIRSGQGQPIKAARAGIPMFAIAAAVFAVLIVYGVARESSIEQARAAAPHARIGLLQPDFDALLRDKESRATMMMDRLSALTKRAEAEGAELTVWPESAYPYTLAHGVKTSPHGARAVLQQGVRGPVLTGVYLTKGGGLGTNSAMLVTQTGDIGPSYDKRHLLWFGETVPMADTFPILRRIFARGTGIDPGAETVPFHVGPIVAAVLNCYEDTLPAAGREAMAVRPNVLVNVTNDAWFAGSAEGELHLRLAVLRAVETRRDLVRAVNRGPTTWVDATGRIRARREATPGLGPSPPLLADAALLDTPLTLYARAGDLPVLLMVLASVLMRFRRNTKSKEGVTP